LPHAELERLRVCSCVWINHFTSVHCYYLSEQGNLPLSALWLSISPTAASLQGLDPRRRQWAETVQGGRMSYNTTLWVDMATSTV